MNTPFDEQDINRVEQYLRDQLPPPERAAFEQSLREQPELAALVAEEQAFEALLRDELAAALPTDVQNDLRQRISQTDAQLATKGFFAQSAQTSPLTVTSSRVETTAPAARQRTLSFTRWAAAASVLLLVVAGYWLYFARPDAAALVAEYNVPETTFLPALQRQYGLVSMGSADAEARKSLADGLTAYANGQYAQAADILRDHATAFPSDGSAAGNDRVKTAALYQALSLAALKNFAAARALLLPLSTDAGFARQSTAQWYLALGYVQTGDQPAAKALLETLRKEDSPYQEAAEELYKVL